MDHQIKEHHNHPVNMVHRIKARAQAQVQVQVVLAEIKAEEALEAIKVLVAVAALLEHHQLNTVHLREDLPVSIDQRNHSVRLVKVKKIQINFLQYESVPCCELCCKY